MKTQTYKKVYEIVTFFLQSVLVHATLRTSKATS